MELRFSSLGGIVLLPKRILSVSLQVGKVASVPQKFGKTSLLLNPFIFKHLLEFVIGFTLCGLPGVFLRGQVNVAVFVSVGLIGGEGRGLLREGRKGLIVV